MAARNGNKVSWQSLHQELADQSKERAEMEHRLVAAFTEGLKGIRDDMAAEREIFYDRFRCVETDIVSLKVADRRWGGLVGLFAAAVAGVGAWLGQK